jgi:hypothetical protein
VGIWWIGWTGCSVCECVTVCEYTVVSIQQSRIQYVSIRVYCRAVGSTFAL